MPFYWLLQTQIITYTNTAVLMVFAAVRVTVLLLRIIAISLKTAKGDQMPEASPPFAGG